VTIECEDTCFFSIIVPVYNVQDYLEECIKSVLYQTFTDFELILVDDGSEDRSGDICDKYAQQDPRVRVLYQSNGGASSARNNGLKIARGNYILFLDSDDFYPERDFLEGIACAAQDKDVVFFNYARYKGKLYPVLIGYPEQLDGDSGTLLVKLVERNAFTSSPCLKAVKREVLIENQIDFEEGTSGEDIEWNAKLMLAAKQFAIAPNCIYAYRIREESITQNITPDYVAMLTRIVRRLAVNLQKGEGNLAKAYNSYVAFQYCTILINARLCRPQLPREKWEEIRQLSWLLQHDTNRIVKLIRMVHSVLGLKITSWLLLVYFKLFCS